MYSNIKRERAWNLTRMSCISFMYDREVIDCNHHAHFIRTTGEYTCELMAEIIDWAAQDKTSIK